MNAGFRLSLLLTTMVFGHGLYLCFDAKWITSPWWMIFALIFQSIIWAYIYLKHPLKLSLRALWLALIGSVILAKSASPAFENDYFRYIWDGHQTLTQGTPYLQSPSTATTPDGLEEIKKQLAFSDVGTIYPPIAQIIFAVLAFLSGTNTDLFLWLLSISGLCLFVFAFRKLLISEPFPGKTKNINDQFKLVLLVALHPIIIKEWVQSSHYDSWLTAMFVFGLTMVGTSKFSFLVGLLSQTKASFLGLMGHTLNHSPKEIIKKLFVFTFAFAFFAIPFLSSFKMYISNMIYFSETWEMNSGIFRWFRDVLESSGNARYLSLGFYFIISLYIWRSSLLGGKIEKCFWALLFLILLSPVANSWYFTWVLPLTHFLPRKAQIPMWLAYCFLPLSYTFYLGPDSPDKFLIWWNIEHLLIVALSLSAFYLSRSYYKENLCST